MLRKIYLLTAEKFPPDTKHPSPTNEHKPSAPKYPSPPPPTKKNNKKRNVRKLQPYEIWNKFRKNMGETGITRKTRMKEIADLLEKVLAEHAFPHTETDVKKQPPPRRFGVGTQSEAATEAVAIPSTSAVYDTPKPRFSSEKSVTTTTMMMMFLSRKLDGCSVGRMSAP